MTPRMAGHGITQALGTDPAFVCYGFDDDRTPTTLIVYARKRMPVPETFGGWPVKLASIRSVRHETFEEF